MHGVVHGTLTFPSPEQSPSAALSWTGDPMVDELPDRSGKCLVQGR
jgi:hypothetical protein